jgi:hypothetical protein
LGVACNTTIIPQDAYARKGLLHNSVLHATPKTAFLKLPQHIATMQWYMFLGDIKNTAYGWLYYTLLCSKPFSTPVLSEPPQAENLAPLRGK